MTILQSGIAQAAGTTGYQIARSLRFNSADSAYLNRTPASAGSRTTWTFSGWLKRTVTGSDTFVLAGYGGASNDQILNFYINSSDKFVVDSYTNIYRVSTRVYRDPGAHMHVVVAWDTNNATAQNRCRIWVNNEEITAWDTNATISSGQLGGINGAWTNEIGRRSTQNDKYFSGYMSDIRFIDGQALTPSSFGETDSATGVWVPKTYTGTYGTNGFWLKFDDNSGTTATTLGKDSSGNGNNWTPNNFSVTAGAGNDSLVDSPTNYGTDTGAGGEVRGNYCTWNPLDSAGTPSNGNLLGDTGSTGSKTCVATMAMQSGKYYWEVQYTSGSGSDLLVGIAGDTFSGKGSVVLSNSAVGWSINSFNGNLLNNGSSTAYGVSFTTNDIISVAYDADTGKVWFAKNGTWMNSGNPATGANPATSSATAPMRPAICSGTSTTQTANANFGQRPFAYTAPSGFKALNTQNLPTPAVGASAGTLAGKYFNTVLYTGNGSARSITGVGFQPDFVWYKCRSTARDHGLFDVVRGATNYLASNLTSAEQSVSGVTSFDADGFSLGTSINGNANTDTYVAWNWKANGAGVSNTAGSITSTVSANTTAGISVVTYSGNSTAGATIGHGLGAVPKLIIIKPRNRDEGWVVGHSSIGFSKCLFLHSTSAEFTTSAPFNNTAPTSSLITLGNGTGTNGSTYNYVAYCFAEVAGFSKFGSYTGNGSADGVFVYLGFRPRFIMGRDASGVDNWWIYDSARNTYNVANSFLRPNLSDAEGSNSTDVIDFLSNGFKIRGASNFLNENGNTFIYAAFAEAPFNYARAR
jgi:hypothetical protein